MRYVHLIEEHPRPIPEHIIQAGQEISDPDARIIAMLGARARLDAGLGGSLGERGKDMTKEKRQVG